MSYTDGYIIHRGTRLATTYDGISFVAYQDELYELRVMLIKPDIHQTDDDDIKAALKQALQTWFTKWTDEEADQFVNADSDDTQAGNDTLVKDFQLETVEFLQ